MSGGAHYVRCLKCSKIIKCPLADTKCLLDHIRDEHPEIRIDEKSKLSRPRQSIGSLKEEEQRKSEELTKPKEELTNDEEIEKLAKQTGISSNKISTMAGFAGISKEELATAAKKLSELSEQGGKNEDGSSVIFKRKFVMKTSDTKKTTHDSCRAHRYRASIKNWVCDIGVLYCPQCGSVRQPMRKKRAEIISPCCAPCIVSCWPLCIFPCAAALNDKSEYLYCCCCKTFLGLYCPETNSIRPNKLYVDPEHETKCPCN